MDSVISIKNWVLKIFNLPEHTIVNIDENKISSLTSETKNFTKITKITIVINKKKSYSYIIKKPIYLINYDDILFLKNSIKKHALDKYPFLSRFIRFFGWWFIFAGTLTTFSVCPFCGQVNCPVGVGSTGILAGFFALLKQYGRQVYDHIKQKLISS